MPLIREPMLAASYNPAVHQTFPYFGTPKVDGVRFYMKGGIVYARSNEPIPNHQIQELLSQLLPDGMDGELVCGPHAAPDHFQRSISAAMSHSHSIDDLNVFLFDRLPPENAPIPGYSDRITALAAWYRNPTVAPATEALANFHEHNITVLTPTALRKPEHIGRYLSRCLIDGYEGIMIRAPHGTYKFGRSTEKEELLLKYKPFATSEALIVGFEEMLHNSNAATIDATGRTKRSTAQGGKLPSGLLGAFVVEDINSKIQFSVGTGPGVTHAFRQLVWANQMFFRGRLISYSFLETGTVKNGKPRMPKFLGFRDFRDMEKIDVVLDQN